MSRGQVRHFRRGTLLVAVTVVLLVTAVGTGLAASTNNWTSYLFNSEHASSTSATSITPANARILHRAWQFTGDSRSVSGQPPRKFYSSPTVYNGTAYIGANTGWFYAIDLGTGAVLWKKMLGYQPGLTCTAKGFVSTAAIAADPGDGMPTVYVGAPDGFLYALDAATGSVRWRSVVGEKLPSTTVNDIFNWASPVVANGHVYMGVSSFCDRPWVRGGLQSFDQANGNLRASYWGVPSGATGSGVWTSPALDQTTGDLYVTTGSGPAPPAAQGDDYSIVRLDGTTLAKQSLWTVPVSDRPADPDFASSPTLFHASVGGKDQQLVAACNKNGVLYAWNRNDLATGPVWKLKVGLGSGSGIRSCLAAPIWNGTNLFEASNPTSVRGVPYLGSLRRLDPSTGAAQWATGLGGIVLGSPSMSAGGVIAAPEYSTDPGATIGLPLVDANNGQVVNFIPTQSGFAQPVHVDDGLLVASADGRLAYYTPRTSGDITPPSAPTVTAARSPDGTSAKLSWPVADSSQGIANYRVFRNGALITTLPGTATSFSDSNLVATSNYAYFVQALDSSGNTSRQSGLRVLRRPAGLPLFADGFESGNLNAWQARIGITLVQSVVHTGSWAARDVNKASAAAVLPAPRADVYARVWFRIAQQGTNPVNLLSLEDEAGKKILRGRVAADGRFQLNNVRISATRTSSARPSLNAWHSLELHLSVNGPQGYAEAWLDGAPVPEVAGAWDLGLNPVAHIMIGDEASGRTLTTYFDDVNVDTAHIGP